MHFKLVVFLALAFFLTTVVRGESVQVSFEGRVLDPSRAPIAGAQVSAILNGRNDAPPVVTDEMGHFSLTIEAGKYTLRISAQGFSQFSQTMEIQQTISRTNEFVL